MSASVNEPKTPVTKGSNGIATATLQNIIKMPGPPAPLRMGLVNLLAQAPWTLNLNVHPLSDLVTNNGGPSCRPPNSKFGDDDGAFNLPGVVYYPEVFQCPICEDKPEPREGFATI